MNWRRAGGAALSVAVCVGLLAGCGDDGQGPAAAGAEVSATGTEVPSETPTSPAPLPPPESLPPVNYRYQPIKGPDLCALVLDFQALLSRFDQVTRLSIPENPQQCPLDLRSGGNTHLLDIKVEFDQNDADVYVWRNLDASMGNLVPIEGMGQSAYYVDAGTRRTLVIRDANLVTRLMFVPNVNSGGAAVTDEESLLLGAVAEHLMGELRVAA